MVVVVVVVWAESYQISVALRLGGFDVLEGGVGGGARKGEEKQNNHQAKIQRY